MSYLLFSLLLTIRRCVIRAFVAPLNLFIFLFIVIAHIDHKLS